MQSIFEKIKDLKNRLTERFPRKRYDDRFMGEVRELLDSDKYVQLTKVNELCAKYEAIIKRGH